MIELFYHLAMMLVFGSMVGLVLTFMLVMRAIARREQIELADLMTRGVNNE